MDIQAVTHWVVIKVRKSSPGGDLIQFIKWKDLRWELRTKYSWYFKYRAALAQVQHPKDHVEFVWDHETPSAKSLQDILQNKISAKQGQVTKWTNIIEKQRIHWKEFYSAELFQPNLDDDPKFKEIKAKLSRLIIELNELKFQYQNIKIINLKNDKNT